MSASGPSRPGPDNASAARHERIEDEAADWLARRNGGLSAAEQVQFKSWLASDDRHASAFTVMEQTWTRLNEPRQQGQTQAVWADIDARRRLRTMRRRYAWATAGAAAAIAALATLVQSHHVETAPTTVARRPVIRTLVDNSKVALNTGAEIEVTFSSGLRHVRLLRGEVLFTVTKDRARPFVVEAGEVEIRAIGTEFSVRRAAEAVDVLVTEGRVSIDHANAGTSAMPAKLSPIFANAGHRVVVPANGSQNVKPLVTAVSADALVQALAWRGRRLEFSEMPLAEAVELFNRRSSLQLTLADPALGGRAITGLLWEDDADGFVRLLETGFDLVTEREGNSIRLRARR